MDNNYFLTELGFSPKKPESDELCALLSALRVDSVHKSGEYPAVFFKKVPRFGSHELKEIAEIQQKIWNYRKVLFLYVSSPTEIRIYNCTRQPFNFKSDNINIEIEVQKYELDRCEKEDKEKLRELSGIFSAIAIDSGSIWLHKEKKYRDKINLQRKVDKKLVESLLRTAKLLKKNKVSPEVVHSLLVRSLFIMYLEDRKATPKELYPAGYKSYLELLDNPDATYTFYAKIEKHFNGNVFPVTPLEISNIKDHPEHLKRIKHCLYDGDPENIQQKLFDWRLFDFSIIQVEVLSEVYENFLNEFDSEEKKRSGAYYTPPSLVELILNQVLPISDKEKEYRLKILDPACGSGIFLVEAYKRLVKRWKNSHPEKEFNFKELSDILQQSVFGVEINPHAIKVAAFSLYLAMLDFLEPKDVWLRDGETFPFLIKDTESSDERDREGKNLFRTNTILENGEFEKHKYDLIIGNPPFSRQSIPQYAKDYIEKYHFASELVIPFIHKSAQLTEKGKIALVFNAKILTNVSKTYQNFRDWLFKGCYVEKVYNLSIFRKAPETFGGRLFSSAVGPIGVVFFSPEQADKPEQTIEYWAPKTFVRNDVIDGVITDSSDFKYLPREICQQLYTKIWKIAQWGTMADYFLINRINDSKKIGSLLNNKNSGVGHQLLGSGEAIVVDDIQNLEYRHSESQPYFPFVLPENHALLHFKDNQIVHKTTNKTIDLSDDIPKLAFILPERIERYCTNSNNLDSINTAIKTMQLKEIYLKYYRKENISDLPLINAFRRKGNKNAYYAPHILIKQGLKNKRVCASYFREDCSFNSKVFGIYHTDIYFLKALTCYFNSIFATYFLFLTSASWGVEREEIKVNELTALPKLSSRYYEHLSEIYDNISEIRTKILPNKQTLKEYEQKAEEIIQQSLNLIQKEEILISDTITYTISLFFDGEKSIALRPVSNTNPETESYSIMLCDEINNFLIAGNTKVNARYYLAKLYTPLCMVVLHFVEPSEVVPPEKSDSDKDFQKHLREIDEFTIKKYSRNIYVHKQIRYYDGDRIFIIKPNQKRFWTRSQAMDDAHSIITEIATQEV